jgi:hypothetical protein
VTGMFAHLFLTREVTVSIFKPRLRIFVILLSTPKNILNLDAGNAKMRNKYPKSEHNINL